MTTEYQLTHLIRTTLACNDDLGFSNARLAAEEILNNPKWREKYKQLSESDADIIAGWRKQTLSKERIR